MGTILASKINEDKYKNALLFFVKYCNNQHLGATKLNKLFYYLDFISFRDRKKSITGDVYVHKQYGPVPSEIDNVLAKLQKDSLLDVQSVDYGEKEGFKYETKKDPDLSIFDPYEKELLEKICKEFSLWSREKIVNQTHLEAPWFYSKPFDVVDFKYSTDIEFFSK